jgi:hypothetical protein
VLPDSFKRPYLIKITSEWCFACVHIEPVWREAVQELEPLGMKSADFQEMAPYSLYTALLLTRDNRAVVISSGLCRKRVPFGMQYISFTKNPLGSNHDFKVVKFIH